MIWYILFGYVLPTVICACFFISEFRRAYNEGEAITLGQVIVGFVSAVPIVNLIFGCLMISTLYDEYSSTVIFKRKN